MRVLLLGFLFALSALGAGCFGGATIPSSEPTLSSTVSDCSSVTGPCAQTDFSQSDHTISSLIFGDGLEWTGYGHDVLAPDSTGQTSGTFRSDVVSALQGVGFTMMRYPGGTLSDLFHWSQAVGPMPSRSPQPTLNVDSSTNK